MRVSACYMALLCPDSDSLRAIRLCFASVGMTGLAVRQGAHPSVIQSDSEESYASMLATGLKTRSTPLRFAQGDRPWVIQSDSEESYASMPATGFKTRSTPLRFAQGDSTLSFRAIAKDLKPQCPLQASRPVRLRYASLRVTAPCHSER